MRRVGSRLSARCPVPSARVWAEVRLYGWKLYDSAIIEDNMSQSARVIAVVDDDASVRRACGDCSGRRASLSKHSPQLRSFSRLATCTRLGAWSWISSCRG